MKTISDRLIFLMEAKDMTQTELASRIGISKQSLYKYLHCKCEPRAEIIAKMAVVLGTSADFIVGLTSNASPVQRNQSDEKSLERENMLLSSFRRLTEQDKARIEERIETLLGR